MSIEQLPTVIPYEIAQYIYDKGVVVDELDGVYMNLPHWFKKLPDGKWQIIQFHELPDQCKFIDIITNINPKQ